MVPMIERRRAYHRRRYNDHLLGGAGLTVLLGAAIVIGFDATNRSSDFFRAAAISIDPLAGASTSPARVTRAGNDRMTTRAGMIPGEIVIETAGKMPLGEWRLGSTTLPMPPVILDSIAAGSHQLSFLEGDSVRWGVHIDLAPGGIAHVVVPPLDASSSQVVAATADTSKR